MRFAVFCIVVKLLSVLASTTWAADDSDNGRRLHGGYPKVGGVFSMNHGMYSNGYHKRYYKGYGGYTMGPYMGYGGKGYGNMGHWKGKGKLDYATLVLNLFNRHSLTII